MTSILEDMEEIKRLADEFLDKPPFKQHDEANEFRKLPDGTLKNTLTGLVEEPVSYSIYDYPPDLPSSNRGW